ncbi:hypothetical protein N9322_01700 [bacterium]|nr:hypothetical protein [bacterium]|tara:strand:+ start:13974 stop:17750 length:3777 start_codon:yes stop_codon:yes gene_type:complete
MASNKFRYPPAPPNGSETFSDNLVGNQITDGSSQMTNSTFSFTQNVSNPVPVGYEINSFSNPITLSTLGIADLEIAKTTASNHIEVFINNDTSDLSSFVLYGSLKKRLNVAVDNIINIFPAALYFDGTDIYETTGYTTAYNISYNITTNRTTFRSEVNYISNPFNIEFTTNGNLLDGHLTPEAILLNLENLGNTATTITKIAEGKTSKLRNLTNEYKDYVLTFNNKIGTKEYKVVEFTAQTLGSDFIVMSVEGKPFGDNTTTTNTKFYLKPNSSESERQLKSLKGIEAFLMTRDVKPIYTAKFKIIKETSSGVKYYDYINKTWPLSDDVNLDVVSSGYTNYLKNLADIGDELDNIKTNLVSRFLTSPTLKEFDTSDQKIEKTLQIYGRSFDDIKTFVDGIAYMTNVTYDGKNNIPNGLIKNFAKTLGWSTPSTLDKVGFLDSVLGVSKPTYSGSSVGMTPAELDVELYRRILLNTGYLFKSKGTRKAIEFLLTLVGAPEALIEFNEYVVLADTRINMKSPLTFVWDDNSLNAMTTGGTYHYEQMPNKFNSSWSGISGGTYSSSTINYSVPLSQFYYETGTTSHNFQRSDYPIDNEGFPIRPRITNNYFFQRGAGWYHRTEEHKSDVVVNQDKSILTGCTPSIINKFENFTWGGFWTGGEYSNRVKSPYLDRFRRFPHMYFGFGLTRMIDDKKSWNRKEPELETRDWVYDTRASYYQTQDERLVLNVKNVDISLNIGQALVYDVYKQSVEYDCFFSADTTMTGGTLYSTFQKPVINSGTTPDKWYGANYSQTIVGSTDGNKPYTGSKFRALGPVNWNGGFASHRHFRRSKGAILRFEVCVNQARPNTFIGFVKGTTTSAEIGTTLNMTNLSQEGIIFDQNKIFIHGDNNNSGSATIIATFQNYDSWPTGTDKFFKCEIKLKRGGGAVYTVYADGSPMALGTYETYGNTMEDMKIGVLDDYFVGQDLILNHIYTFDETKAGFSIDTRNMHFKRFLNNFWKVLIDVRNRMTINDGKTGGYPVLQKIYLQYLEEYYGSCGDNNKYTYNKMLDYVSELGSYWIKLVEKMVPATTLWTSGEKVENSAFHRDKFVYRCFSPTGNTMPIIPQMLLTGTALSGYTSYPQAMVNSTPMSMRLPAPPTPGSLYFNSIISGATQNPISSYANQYNIDNQNQAAGSEIVRVVTNRLANSYHSNKDKYLSQSIFTKQGATDNILHIEGLKCFGTYTQSWIDGYNIVTTTTIGNYGNQAQGQSNNVSSSNFSY